ncbi:hypothetical protein CDL15_Pgr001278 [Punica granatum]|uniref:Uncharacterized protein n=1 Tax=Punica granatum TaxID=22663 RepID=A0A218WHX1_PUNGR|nr:hypothetical protein CDL15_Pgr017704 [Punica granatum]OWM73164.1 hypothetical protein CDL15_Pgr001278 [Punica granatum]
MGQLCRLILQTVGRLYCSKEKKNQRSEERRRIQNRMKKSEDELMKNRRKKMTRVFAIQLCNFHSGRGGFEGEKESEEQRAMTDSEIRRIRAEGRKTNSEDELMKKKNKMKSRRGTQEEFKKMTRVGSAFCNFRSGQEGRISKNRTGYRFGSDKNDDNGQNGSTYIPRQ